MTKRESLHQWLLEKGEWVYLHQVPFADFQMSRQSASSELRALCESKRADYRIVGLKQYRGKLSPQQQRAEK